LITTTPTPDLASVSSAPLSPLSFLAHASSVWRDRVAVVEGGRAWTYEEHSERIRRAAGMLRDKFAISDGARVATLLPNVAAMLELHYAVPGAGGVLVPMNTRLAASDYAFILEHSSASVLVAHTGLRAVAEQALALMTEPIPVLWAAHDAQTPYETELAAATPLALELPADERQLLSINYTSGTTGSPKGVMTAHRGAYLHSLGVIAETGLTVRSSYLWTLPMFHCNGWAYTWAVTAMGGKHVCLPEVSASSIWAALSQESVTHMCAAPTVVTMMLGADAATPCDPPVALFIGGAPPAPALLERAATYDISVTHLYGLTETYGPLCVCAWNPSWDELPDPEQARLRARQGVATVVTEQLRVVDGEMRDVPADGETIGEVVMRGNNIMLGYYRDPEATARAFAGGWFHSGDLGVMHPDGYIELRDRLKDIIISGGENIASIEIEQALLAHPAVEEAAVVGAPNDRWGEVPHAFITVRGTAPPRDEIDAFLRARLARFKVPKEITVVDDLPKTGTGKIQKFVLRETVKQLSPP
jgi:fatty-acyl-CoA synthase